MEQQYQNTGDRSADHDNSLEQWAKQFGIPLRNVEEQREKRQRQRE